MTDEPTKHRPRELARIRCAACGTEVQRLTVTATGNRTLDFIAECHGARQTLSLDEHALTGHKIVGGEAFGDNPGIDLRPWGEGYEP